MMRRAALGTLSVGAVACLCALGQTPGSKLASGALASQNSPYTLQVYSRAVLTDVTVTDKKGSPVTGLKQSEFQIFDNGKPQRLASFEEHRQQVAKLEPISTTPGAFSNNFLRNPPPQVNALLFDTTTIQIVDQMYLFQQMIRFVDSLPAGEPVAVFLRNGDVTLQLTGFTDDHAALMTAIKRAIPKLQQPTVWADSDIDTLRHMATYLRQVPGRKNLIWFTSGSNQLFSLDADMNPDLYAMDYDQERRAIYDELESERIAIYPIDARGLTFKVPNPKQLLQMLQDAEATGGKAYLNTNGLAQAAQHILSTDGDYYTLTYSPQDLKNNGDWHRVAVKLERRGYELNYRRGYYDDGSNQPAQPGGTRRVLMDNAKEVEVHTEQDDPLLFAARVEPVPPGTPAVKGDPPLKRGEQRYIVQYSVPAKDVNRTKVQEDMRTAVMGSAVLAFNHYGDPVAKRMQQVTLGVNEALVRAQPNAEVQFTQTVNLPNGRDYLYLEVWNPVTARLGTVNAEVEVQKAGKGQ